MALHAGLATAYEHKGESGAAARHLERLLELVPQFSISNRRLGSGYADTPDNRRFEDGLRKAGLAEV